LVDSPVWNRRVSLSTFSWAARSAASAAAMRCRAVSMA
jgi:hypothetical protein